MNIRRATYNFIYSFIPVAGDMTYDKRVIDSFINSTYKNTKMSGKGKPTDEHYNRIGLSSYLNLNIEMGYEELKSIVAEVGEINLTIYPLFRYYSHGCSLTFHVVAEKSEGEFLSTQEAYELSHLISTEGNKSSKKRIKIAGKNNKTTIYELYREYVNEKLIAANLDYLEALLSPGEINKRENSIPEIVKSNKKSLLEYLKANKAFIDVLHDYYTIDRKIIFEKLISRFQPFFSNNKKLSNEDKYKITVFTMDNIISLFCVKENLIKIDDNYESSIPWVVINLELDKGEALDSFCSTLPNVTRDIAIQHKLERIEKYEQQIVPFLYRMVDSKYEDFRIEPSYSTFSMNSQYKGFNNLYLDSRLYLQMSRRAILTICSDNEKKPASYVLPTLLGICEMTHTRWQSLIMINMQLDKHIKAFSNHVADKYLPSEKLGIILNLVKKTLANMQNPLCYVVSGDSLREINDLLADTFKTIDLENHAIRKVSLLEKIYDLGLRI